VTKSNNLSGNRKLKALDRMVMNKIHMINSSEDIDNDVSNALDSIIGFDEYSKPSGNSLYGSRFVTDAYDRT